MHEYTKSSAKRIEYEKKRERYVIYIQVMGKLFSAKTKHICEAKIIG